jgi:uncharacterized membrane protein
VDDLADACAFLLNMANPPDLINVGTGTDVTIRELTEHRGRPVSASRQDRLGRHRSPTARHPQADGCLRQSLGLLVASIAVWMGMMVVGFIPVVNLSLLVLAPLVWIAFFVLWIMGLISAINGQQKPLPVVGAHFQKWFAGAFV